MNHTSILSHLSLASLLVLAPACGGATSGGATDTFGDDTAAADVAQDTSAADAAEPDTALADATSDAAGDTVAVDTGLGPAPTPEERPLAIAWAIQSDQTEGASLLYPAVVALPDGGFVAMATFDGTVTFGEREVVSDDEKYTHTLFTRVTPEGEVAALRWVCDNCGAYSDASIAVLPSGELAFVSVADGEVVLDPGGDAELTLDTGDEPALLVTVLTQDGALARARLVAELPGWGEIRALIATPDGGLVAAGNTQGLVVPDGPAFGPEDGWHYPGRAFVLGADADLNVTFAEQASGDAGSDVTLLHLDGDALYAIGDFGGYPLHVPMVLGAGTDGEVTLEAVSSDDDPAMDIFVSRWDLAALTDGRPRLEWARRLSHYSNGPRPGTFARSDGAGGVLFRIVGADGVEPDDDGQIDTVPAYGSENHLLARASAEGEVSAVATVSSPLSPAWDGFLSAETWWSGREVAVGGDDGPVFEVPEATTGPDGVKWSGTVLGRWRADGALLAAGMLLQRTKSSGYPLTIRSALPQDDGSVILVMHGSPTVTLVPSEGDEVLVSRDPGYERLVVTRLRLR